MNKTCLLVGDSLGLPRSDVDYYSTWPYIVQSSESNYHFISRFQRALTSKQLCDGEERDWLEFYKPSVVILQVGIVDCAPRLVRKSSILMRFLSIMPPKFKSMIWRMIKANWNREARKCDVSLVDFKGFIYDYLRRCDKLGLERLFFIKIANPSAKLAAASPSISNQIANYNLAIDELSLLFDFCSVLEIPVNDRCFVEDGYHLNHTGHRLLANDVIESLNS